ncbi:hypothetical protein Pan97_31300 [Bremerella volcania]|uniref:Carboxypeptidase regulatory-like domain-containing protein n=1 Tax=Bremerella volcania TaxID=2527984 RepID=A0A518CA46_9BACT|nr:carboxypeptidase-like regulatory domain-containing protein [Bremerella volcania]QDU76085.1 hypothetical protein Pan97_31300 [Bremerella volcania]
MRINLTVFFYLAAPLIIASAAGCSGNAAGLHLVPAKGTITLDGTPLAGADVEFTPENVKVNEDGLGGSSGFANTDDSGHFEMYTASYAGVQPGEYRVRINKISQPEITNPEARVPKGKEMVPPQYNTQSDLIVEIDDDGNTDLNFELKSP